MSAARSSGIERASGDSGAAPAIVCSKSSTEPDPSAGDEQRTPFRLAASSIAGAKPRVRLPSVTRNAASLSLRMYASLSAFVCGLTTMKAPPASRVPKMATVHGAVLSM
jgi:hypothetical protein